MRRHAVRFERGLVGVDLDQEEKCPLVFRLMHIEAFAAGLCLQGGARMARQTLLERFHHVRPAGQVSGMEQGLVLERPIEVLLGLMAPRSGQSWSGRLPQHLA